MSTIKNTDLLAIKSQQRLNGQRDNIALPEAFLAKFPDMARSKADKLFQRYLSVMLDEFVVRLAFAGDGETHVSLQKLLRTCADFKYKKQRFWVWNEFKDIYPIITVLEKGSNLSTAANMNEKNSKVKIVGARYLNMMLQDETPAVVYSKLFSEEDEDAATDAIHIDMDNLRRFVDCTTIELERCSDDQPKLRAKLLSNLWQAQVVLKVGMATEERFGGSAILPMVAKRSPFGRTYYKGLNIQNVSKEVRSAIIGHHFQYDMNAAVFATKLYLYGMALGGDNNVTGMTATYTRQYLADKTKIRKRLARECFEGISIPEATALKAIKNGLTSIGFGAKMTGRMWMGKNGMEGTALTDIIVSPIARERFINDTWVQNFAVEQIAIEDEVLAFAQGQDGYDEMCATVREANGINGRVTRAGLLAFMYQHWETQIMDVAIDAMEQYGITPVARIHDAFIVRQKLADKVLDDISAAWGLRAYLTLDCDEVEEWIDGSFKMALIHAKRDNEEHSMRMAKADEVARIYSINKAHLVQGGAA